ncbi:homogentisate phytyltransferase [Synechococcales cyanobacterium C]|uniref:Homogentisate phytyltransferase n=1 Tax=Petrachloros mirabilis ULC683 TaxID=2781853 RepID=A0A8K2AC72_9CYAN|nr:homogentisate phytyltransferase [Petrachloros mirabilis]NCJ05781.1 homogentisate phytyltransferase [Petrachloros mirabilis ULC683]
MGEKGVSVWVWLAALWRFSRPHTIIGTTLSIVGLALLAWTLTPRATPDLWELMIPLLATWVPSVCANVYIVGLNQLEDIDIDRVNKPHLPLASGVFSVREGRAIVAVTGLLALVLAGAQGQWLSLTVILSMVIGTVYSWPPFRLKRFPFWAALCIFGVRGLVVNLGFFLHFQQGLGGGTNIPPEVWALTVFVVGFAFAIAVCKDIPDIEGDRQFQIRTLTLRLGASAVFNLARWVLTGCYVFLLALTTLGGLAVQPGFMVITHLGILVGLWWRSQQVDLGNQWQISRFYQFIWKLFFWEYLLFPLACVWR